MLEELSNEYVENDEYKDAHEDEGEFLHIHGWLLSLLLLDFILEMWYVKGKRKLCF